MRSHVPTLHARSPRGAPRDRGFTIIELLVAATISSLLMWAIFMIFDTANKMAGLLDGEIEVRQNARAIFARMEIDLASAFLDVDGDYFEGTSESVKCIAAVPTDDHNVTEISYHRDNKRLYRTIEIDGKASSRVGNSTDEEHLLADGVTNLQLRYWNPEWNPASASAAKRREWLETWNFAKQLPRAVRVEIQVEDMRQAIKRSFFDTIPVGQGR
jgi:prepilin-type N-terminal cleavage/methylation domain-containing protein